MNAYNLTERVRKVLAMAREEAARLHHEYVGTEHLLLGLVREGGGVAATVLENFNVATDEIQRMVEQTVKKGRSAQAPRVDLPYTSRAKQVLELAMKEAGDLGHSYVGSEHLLLGLLAEQKGIGGQVLIAVGLTVDATRAEVLRILGTEVPPQTLSPYPSKSYDHLAAQRARPLAGVEIVLNYRDGGRFQASFATAQDAQGFLAWVAPRGPA